MHVGLQVSWELSVDFFSFVAEGRQNANEDCFGLEGLVPRPHLVRRAVAGWATLYIKHLEPTAGWIGPYLRAGCQPLGRARPHSTPLFVSPSPHVAHPSRTSWSTLCVSRWRLGPEQRHAEVWRVPDDADGTGKGKGKGVARSVVSPPAPPPTWQSIYGRLHRDVHAPSGTFCPSHIVIGRSVQEVCGSFFFGGTGKKEGTEVEG